MLSPTTRLVFNACMISAATIAISIRMFVRYRFRSFPLTRTWVLSDVFVMIALLFSAASVGFDMWLTVRRIKNDLDILTYTERSLQAMMLNQAGYFATLWSVKASFLCAYFLRIEGLARYLRVSLRGSAILLAATAVGVFVALFAWCRPVQRNWALMPDEYCSPLLSAQHTTFGYLMHMGTDIPVLAIPFFILRSLRLERAERFGAGFLFALGFCTVISSTVQYTLFLTFIRMNQNGESGTEETVDRIYIVATVEIFLSILAVCGPSLRVLLRKTSKMQTHVTELTVRSTLKGDDKSSLFSPGLAKGSPMTLGRVQEMTEDEEAGFAGRGADVAFGSVNSKGGLAFGSVSSRGGLEVEREMAKEIGLAR